MLVSFVLLSACKSVTGCESQEQVVEAMFPASRAEYQSQIAVVDGLKTQGYNCQSAAIRDMFGTSIGDRYTCTRCP